MNNKAYKVSFILWDITGDESKGDLLRKSDEMEVQGLGSIQDEFWAFYDKQKKFLGPRSNVLTAMQRTATDLIDINYMRVAMSRNNGVGTLRTRFDIGKRRFRIDTRAYRVAGTGILQTLYAQYSVVGSRPKIEMTPGDGNDYWIKIYWCGEAARFATPAIEGQHPLHGRDCRAELYKNDLDAHEAIYLIED